MKARKIFIDALKKARMHKNGVTSLAAEISVTRAAVYRWLSIAGDAEKIDRIAEVRLPQIAAIGKQGDTDLPLWLAELSDDVYRRLYK